MKAKAIESQFQNCFLLLIPVIIWNVLLANQLPTAFRAECFWKDIPAWLTYGENGSRILVFALAGLMPLSFSRRSQESGYYLYLAGLVLYFFSWLALIYFPHSLWSTSLPGFMAPAYTPLFWLIGIGLIGDSFYFSLPFNRWIFMLTAFFFVIFHSFHTYSVYCRLH
ncbi:hypothetical protein ACFQ4C_09910 [Larkinella insperata]|uniref:Uncharacterized protein n=1 Tax=Larkinella insperata TaxID=332158 RepID=A0ABW3Q892_9BACT|nr:hypothetical protein [Larkinella insperata]